jgi:hypothetical protein
MTYAYDLNFFFAHTELEYFGHMFSKDGQRPSHRKIKGASEWQRPKTVQETQRFLRFCKFYRRYVSRYSHMAAPFKILVAKAHNFNGLKVN